MKRLKEERRQKKTKGKKISRNGISAESYGDFNEKVVTKPKVFLKTTP